LRDTLWDVFGWPPETDRALDFLDAHREHDERAALRAFEQETGVRPDPLLVARMRRALKERPGEVILPARLGRLLDEHRQRLRRRQEAFRVPEETARIRSGIRVYGSLERSLEALAGSRERHEKEKALRERIPGAAYVERAERPPGDNIAGATASAIRDEGLERPDQPDLVVPLSHEIRDDVTELVAFFRREDLRQLRRDAPEAGLSAQEEQVFGLVLDGLDNAEIVASLPRSNDQVRQEKLRAFRKIRKYRQAAGL
jgi:DNA-binding CsgD family transcriptional regulator